MWPFRSWRRTKAANAGVKLIKLQLGTYYGMYRLEQALVSDAYVAGYVFNRIMGLASIAANLTGGLTDDVDLMPIVAKINPQLFGPENAQAQLRFIKEEIAADASLKASYQSGHRDAFAFHRYLIGAEDFTKHAMYPQLKAEVDEFRSHLDGQRAKEFTSGSDLMDALAAFESRTFGKRLRDLGFDLPLAEQKPGWYR